MTNKRNLFLISVVTISIVLLIINISRSLYGTKRIVTSNTTTKNVETNKKSNSIDEQHLTQKQISTQKNIQAKEKRLTKEHPDVVDLDIGLITNAQYEGPANVGELLDPMVFHKNRYSGSPNVGTYIPVSGTFRK